MAATKIRAGQNMLTVTTHRLYRSVMLCKLNSVAKLPVPLYLRKYLYESQENVNHFIWRKYNIVIVLNNFEFLRIVLICL